GVPSADASPRGTAPRRGPAMSRILRRLWTLPADVLAVLVARSCGTRIALRRPRRFGAWPIRHDSWLARLLAWSGLVAITIGDVALIRTPISTRIWLHEREHARQWERWGPIFPLAYLAA